MLDRIRDKLDTKLRTNRAGYRHWGGYTEHVHVLRRIIERCDSKNIPLVSVFVDFKKVFDSIDFNIIVKILRRYGFPEPITDAIRLLYDGTCSCLKSMVPPRKSLGQTLASCKEMSKHDNFLLLLSNG